MGCGSRLLSANGVDQILQGCTASVFLMLQVESAVHCLYYVRCTSTDKTQLRSSCTVISTLLSKTGLPGYKTKLTDTSIILLWRKKVQQRTPPSPILQLPDIISEPVRQCGGPPSTLAPEPQGPRKGACNIKCPLSRISPAGCPCGQRR